MTRLELDLDLAENCPVETASQREWMGCAQTLAAENRELQSKLKTLLEAAEAFTKHLDDECMECEDFRAAVKKAREGL